MPPSHPQHTHAYTYAHTHTHLSRNFTHNTRAHTHTHTPKRWEGGIARNDLLLMCVILQRLFYFPYALAEGATARQFPVTASSSVGELLASSTSNQPLQVMLSLYRTPHSLYRTIIVGGSSHKCPLCGVHPLCRCLPALCLLHRAATGSLTGKSSAKVAPTKRSVLHTTCLLSH
jgi:hypothetical protein